VVLVGNTEYPTKGVVLSRDSAVVKIS